MADGVLQSLSAKTLFDLRGVVAVVTGGGTVRNPPLNTPLNMVSSIVSCQGIGLMISSTLIANGATVYVIGPNQNDLDRCSLAESALYHLLTISKNRWSLQ
jgi:NAD(P)-dependent dehydrogenase (short-subunit alcohol dehydrogenase family)